MMPDPDDKSIVSLWYYFSSYWIGEAWEININGFEDESDRYFSIGINDNYKN